MITSRHLAPAATFERESREKRLAAVPLDRELPEGALDDLGAWTVIEDWLHGRRWRYPVTFADMEAAAAKAEEHLARICRDQPGAEAMKTRHARVRELLLELKSARAQIDRLNADLRARATAEREGAGGPAIGEANRAAVVGAIARAAA